MGKQTNVNTIVDLTVAANNKVIWFALKETMKLAGWTVTKSSDGLTYNSGGDQITHSGSGAGGMNNTNAHATLREPGGRREICFQWTTAMLCRIKYSALARFTGGTPSATRVPSATDEQVIAGSGSDATPTGASFFNAANVRYHIVCLDSPIGGAYAFYLWVMTTPGSTSQAGGFWLEPMAPGSYDALDVDPCIIGAATGGGSFEASFLAGVGKTWLAYGTGSATFLTITGGFNATFNGSLPADLASNKDINGRPLFTVSSGGVRVKGYGALLAIKGPSRGWPATANRATDAYVYLGNLVIPWANGVEPGV